MKYIVASCLALAASTVIFAEPVSVECTTQKVFTDNNCHVCYTDTLPVTTNASGWQAQATSLTVPWKHDGGTLSEVIIKEDQDLPSIVVSDGVTYTPTDAESIWENGTDINWTPLGTGGDVQTYIDPGQTKNLYTLKTGANLTISGNKADATVLVRSSLVYDLMNLTTNTFDSSDTREICVLNTIKPQTSTDIATTATATTTTATNNAVVTNATSDTSSTAQTAEVPVLNSAGPNTEVTAEQTATQAGPEMWIFLLLAFVFAGAWSAWKKSSTPN